MTIANLTDRKLEIRVAKHNRRLWRNEAYRKLYKALSTGSVLRFRSTPGTIKASAKKIVMQVSQRERRNQEA
jgi:hypothetical protein